MPVGFGNPRTNAQKLIVGGGIACLRGLSCNRPGDCDPDFLIPTEFTTRDRRAERKGRDREYRGLPAVDLVPLADHRGASDAMLAILAERDFKDGTIEIDVAGSRRADSEPDDRGFIGIAFRVQGHGSKFEYIYLRPVNDRADDQLQRNHSVQILFGAGFSLASSPRGEPGTV